jgi:hypothetical protein
MQQLAESRNMSSEIPKQLIRASVQGVVYLIDSPSGSVYTYNLTNPTYIGKLEKIPEEDKHMISKTNGCLANARVVYRSDIRDVMAELRASPSKKLSLPTIPTTLRA